MNASSHYLIIDGRDNFYACRSCAEHLFKFRHGASSYPRHDEQHTCELGYEGICDDMREGENQ